MALLVIPPVTAFIGWLTNWSAIKMIFSPQEFRGIGPIGWQGVLPQRADKFANDVADTVTSDILSARDLAERFDPDEIERVFAGILDDYTYELVWEATEILQPLIWEEWGPEGQRLVIDMVKAETRGAARKIFADFQGVSDDLLDLHHLVTTLLTGENVERLVRLFQEMGRKEFRFIEIYGGVFGFLIGLVQVGFLSVFGIWWMMPIVGVIVGLVTNWLAIQMIFRPQEELRVGPIRYQGMFPKRQAEIAADYGRIAADEIFTPANLFRLLSEGEAGERIATDVLDRVAAEIEAQKGMLSSLTQAEVTPAKVAEIQDMLVQRVAEAAPEIQPAIEDFAREKLDVANTVSSKLGSLTKAEFEQMLRGLLEEDEWILIALGGVLGGAVGFLQGGISLALGV